MKNKEPQYFTHFTKTMKIQKSGKLTNCAIVFRIGKDKYNDVTRMRINQNQKKLATNLHMYDRRAFKIYNKHVDNHYSTIITISALFYVFFYLIK